jgi:Flp pilus assembly protein TadG
MTRHPRTRRSRGAALVEAALVLPLLMTVVLGFFDFGAWELQSTQAASAARDGARVAILRYKQADVPGSADNQAVVDAVKRRLAGQKYTSLTVTCVGPASATPITGGCAAASVDSDRVLVKIAWSRTPWTFVGGWFGTKTIDGSSTMVINGLPTP